MQHFNYYIHGISGSGKTMLLIKWLTQMTNKYGIQFPYTGNKYTPVINLRNNMSLLRKLGGWKNKKIGIFDYFDSSSEHMKLGRLQKAFQNNMLVIITSLHPIYNQTPKIKELLSKYNFIDLDLDSRLYTGENIDQCSDRLLNCMELTDLHFEKEKYFSFPFNFEQSYAGFKNEMKRLKRCNRI